MKTTYLGFGLITGVGSLIMVVLVKVPAPVPDLLTRALDLGGAR